MAETLKATMLNPVQGHQVITNAWMLAKSLLMAGHRCTLEVKPETRSDSQNKLLHALIGEIAASHEWCGKKHDTETWKRLLVAAWTRARGESVELLPALDGYGVDIVFRRTSKMTKGEVNELIEFIEAWRAMQ
jgi:hypothetical protein